MSTDVQETVYGPAASDLADSRLADLCVPEAGVQTGPFGSQLHQEDYVPVGTPIITVEHLGENRILHDGVPRVAESDRSRLEKYSLRAGDIVFSRVGSVDRRALVRDPEAGWLFSGRCLRVRPDPRKVDPVFLSYFFGLPAFKNHIRAIAVGATMPSLNTSLLSDIRVLHPRSVDEQRRLAQILSALDDKIELNRRMSETLESMASALFKSWFIDFDPVRAKAGGRSPAVPKAIAGLFPDALESSGLGAVPASWGIGVVEDLAEVNSGKRPGARYAEATAAASVPLWGGNGPMAFVAEPLIDHPALITGRVGTLGVVFRITAPCWPSDNTLIIRPRSDYALEYLFFCLREIDFHSLDRGSTQPLLTQTDLKRQAILLPPEKVLSRFHAVTRDLYDRSDEAAAESRSLAALRDALLPKLVSGEIRLG